MASVAVLGAAGYAGAVAAALVHRHPELDLTHVTARTDAGARLDDVHPRTRVPLELEPPTTDLDVDAAVVAYPHGAAAPVVAELLERGIRVVDLSADFRLHELATYEEWYGDHGAPELIGEAVYGLPELHREEIRAARLVANPGCYPTAAILALAPLARAGLLGNVIIDAKSGVSGAGREPSHGKHFVTVDETVTPYKVGAHRHTPEIEQELGVPVTFTPHLVPRLTRRAGLVLRHPGRRGRRRRAVPRRLRGRAVGRGRRRTAGHAGGPRDELLPHLRARRPAHGRGDRVRHDRQPLQGNLLAGRAEPQPDVRARRVRGPMTFASRWVEPPVHVTEAADGGLPAGFRAAGVACGLKPSGAPDLGLLVSDEPDTVSAARFTRSGVLAAPVLLCQQRCRLDAIRAVVVNSGNANAATGNRGFEAAAKMQGGASMVARVPEDQVAVASTGVIGVQLDGEKVTKGIVAVREELAAYGDDTFGEAIRTTDKFPKSATLDVELPSGTVRLTAQAKGAGMISPAFATMLCFVQTDAALAPETADLLLGVCVKRSFDRISVDGQLSTNDTAILMASGASGVRIAPESEDEVRFGEALDYLLRRLALLIVRDGEGSKRVGRVTVHGGHEPHVIAVARAVADSPLVKAALHGGDPNWGRIAQSVGKALFDAAPLPVDIWIEDVQVCAAGAAQPYDEPALAQAVAGEEVEYTVGLPGTGAEAEVFFSDLSHEYVTINAEYTT